MKTFKSISYWELWPGSTGHAPTFGNLGKLARLYRCSVGDLLVDLPDFRDHDEAPRAVLGAEPGGLVAARHAQALLADLLPGHHGASARNGAR